jgi:hypothetical protein
VSWPAAFFKRFVNFSRSLLCIRVGRRVQPISVGMRSFPASCARQQLICMHLLKEILKLTQPVLNEVFPHGARGAISHDLKERGAFAPTEAISQPRCFELWIDALRCCESSHAGVGQLLYGNFWCLEVRGCLGPNGFIEWERVAKEAIRATVVG